MSDDGTQGKRTKVALRNLFLDPNNFRIVDHPEYKRVSPGDEFNADVQRRTTSFVLGRNGEFVRDLIASFKENGWLDIDPILVQQKHARRYLVVEGNRRVATLKRLQRQHEERSVDLGSLDSALFSAVPVVLYKAGEDRHHMVMMGLHHITGKRRWPAVNRARAMKRLLDHFDNDADAVCRALGVSKREFNLSIRTLALIDVYRTSDYGDGFRSEQYNLFRDVLRSPAMRAWLEWDEEEHVPRNQPNRDRLFSWMSREVDSVADDDGAPTDTQPQSAPVVTTVAQVRELAKIIDDPLAVKRLEETRSLQEATLSSRLLVKNEIQRAFGSCDAGVKGLTTKISELGPDELDRVDQIIGQLQGLALAHKRRPPVAGRRLPWQPFNEITLSQFSSLTVNKYRGIDGLVLEDPGRVNLIVGVNNAGKTSLLEAIYLLAHQNDERALLDVIRLRGRIEGEPDPFWLAEQMSKEIGIGGTFDQVKSNVARFRSLRFNPADENTEEHASGDQTSKLFALAIDAAYGERQQMATATFFSDRPRRTTFDGQNWLCRAAFTSPFWANRPSVLARCNKESLKAGTKAKIIDFIRKHVDRGLDNIEHADKFDRFLVTHKDFKRAPDLSSFGEGVRRVFEIGLLFARVQGGVLLIDEFENAIHTRLLDDFTRLVQMLADELNVQVFLTTHSKEAIDALIGNEYRTDGIVGYALRRTDGGVEARRYGGERLLRLHQAVDFDLRGVR